MKKIVSNRKLLKIIYHLENKLVSIERHILHNNKILESKIDKIYYENELVKTQFNLLDSFRDLNQEVDSLKKQIETTIGIINQLLN